MRCIDLDSPEDIAIVPPPLEPNAERRETGREREPLAGWVRGALLGLALGLAAVFALARYLDPYEADGTPMRQGTHQKLGLPPCTFYDRTGLPCPSCGMTTSFALLAHGDVVNSLRANCVGTAVALFGLLLLPWCLVGAFRRQPPALRALEKTGTYVVLAFLVLMMLRWALVLLLGWHV
jgi:hypothetical protein